MPAPGADLLSVRHAETEWNRRRVFMGDMDVPPTAAGLARAAELGKSLQGTIDIVFCSPLSRAARTAAALFPGLPVVVDDRLRERGMGEWEGLPKDDVRRARPEAFPRSHLDVTFTPPGGEDLEQLIGRVGSFLDDVTPRARAARVAVVSHNGWIRAAQYLCAETTLEDFHAFPVPPLVPTPIHLPGG